MVGAPHHSTQQLADQRCVEELVADKRPFVVERAQTESWVGIADELASVRLLAGSPCFVGRVLENLICQPGRALRGQGGVK